MSSSGVEAIVNDIGWLQGSDGRGSGKAAGY